MITRPQVSVIFVWYDSLKKLFHKNWQLVKTGLFATMIEFNVKKVVVTVLQGSVVTQTTLGGLTIYILRLQIS